MGKRVSKLRMGLYNYEGEDHTVLIGNYVWNFNLELFSSPYLTPFSLFLSPLACAQVVQASLRGEVGF